MKRTRISMAHNYRGIDTNKFNTKDKEELFNEFNLHCKARNLSSKTIEFYYFCWKPFNQFLENEDIQLCDIDIATINSYVVYLKEENTKNDVSIATRTRGIRTILYYFMKHGYISDFKIMVPKAEKAIKEVYTDSELKVLLTKPTQDADFTEYRNWVISNFLIATGVRSRTLVNIRIRDVDLENQLVKLSKTKSKRQQIIPLSHTLCKILIEFIKYRKGDLEDYLFCTLVGRANATYRP